MISEWHIQSINKLCKKTERTYKIINIWIQLQYTKSKMVSSEIFYGYGCGGWRKRLVQFHKQGDAISFCFVFGLTVPMIGGWRVEGGSQLVAVAAKVGHDISYLLFAASSVSMYWRLQVHSTHAYSYRRRGICELPRGLISTHPFPNGDSWRLWTWQWQQWWLQRR